ncbi:hypothetical protein VE03_01707 [Pseudogymnoascus sp. 23342-1-I1]|nr:hypothetical protein VE03_01707 [Pseudogymnoascus sp. 23342-1-I1]
MELSSTLSGDDDLELNVEEHKRLLIAFVTLVGKDVLDSDVTTMLDSCCAGLEEFKNKAEELKGKVDKLKIEVEGLKNKINAMANYRRQIESPRFNSLAKEWGGIGITA